MHDVSLWTVAAFLFDLMVRVGLSLRVVMRRLSVGVSLAWLFVILVFPFAGAVAYLMFGELRLGRRRAARAALVRGPYRAWLSELTERTRPERNSVPREGEPLSRLAETLIGIPPLGGNRLELFPAWEAVLRSLVRDIDAAQRTCHLEFYIWNAGGLADEVAEALMRAAARGVVCRVLLDDIGSRPFLRSAWAGRLRGAGIKLQAALPARLWRMLFVRYDLRLHRKIVVIDGRIGYTGSLNLVDPRHFKQDAGVGEWVDAMARIEGPVVEPLAITFLEDWSLETGETAEALRETGDARPLERCGEAFVQVIPSGPADGSAAIQRIVMAAIYGAQSTLVLTTPYFVPDEAMVGALACAAQRGVDVRLIVPARVDSRLVRLASGAFRDDLAAAGVRIVEFDGGLLHTKSVTVDGRLSLFGSLNLDPRSMHLNFEITLAVYDETFTRKVRELQAAYESDSHVLDLAEREGRKWPGRLADNVARLVGPLL